MAELIRPAIFIWEWAFWYFTSTHKVHRGLVALQSKGDVNLAVELISQVRHQSRQYFTFHILMTSPFARRLLGWTKSANLHMRHLVPLRWMMWTSVMLPFYWMYVPGAAWQSEEVYRIVWQSNPTCQHRTWNGQNSIWVLMILSILNIIEHPFT